MSSAAAFGFGTPWVLLALLALPLWWLHRRLRRPSAVTLSRVAPLAAGPRRGRALGWMLFALRNLAIAAAIVALARPRFGSQSEAITGDGINIMLVIDLSSSMLALDFQPENRLEVAKETMKRFVSGRAADRIGVVSFAGDALTQVPLTLDYGVVTSAIDNLQAGQLDDGTAIGTAIATAANRLRVAPGRSRVMILATDGVNNRGSIDPRTAARAAAALASRSTRLASARRDSLRFPSGVGCLGCATRIRKCALTNVCCRILRGRRMHGSSAPATRRRCDRSTRRSINSSAHRCACRPTCVTLSSSAGRSKQP